MNGKMPESSIIKYMVRLKFNIEGVVEKADVIGAIFGQTEGLFGPELNLNELQKNWKIGRIEINLTSKNDQTYGEVLIPSSTDITTAALLAAAVESVDKVGPCAARFQLVEIEDVRASKRKLISDRAKEILKMWSAKSTSEGEELVREVTEAAKPGRIASYGPEGLPAGPGMFNAETVILVEGRADVLNLLRAGVDNTLAVEGAKIPDSVIKLAKERNLIAFLDGDRGGDLIQKELQQVAKVSRVYRAPAGKEVEELTPVELLDILQGRREERREERREARREERREEPREELPSPPPRVAVPKPTIKLPEKLGGKLKDIFPDLKDSLEAYILDEELNVLGHLPVSELAASLAGFKGAKHIVFDGIVTQRLVDAAAKAGVTTIIGYKVSDAIKKPDGSIIETFSSVGLA
jgi:DNA primase